MIMLIFFAILSIIPNGMNCNYTINADVLSDNQTTIGTLNKSVLLKCPFLTIESQINVIIWYYDNVKEVLSLTPDNSSRSQDKKRIRGSKNGTLLIENLRYGDAKMYKCEAYGQTKMFEVNISLTVNGPPLNFSNFTYKAVSDSILEFSWEINITKANQVLKYNISLCESFIKKECTNVSLINTQHTYTIENLKPFTEYYVTIFAINDIGNNKMSTLRARTKSGKPLVTPYINVTNVKKRSVDLHIKCKDCDNITNMRGIFKYFTIAYMDRTSLITFNLTTNIPIIKITIVNLHPYANYTFLVSASNGDFSGPNVSFSTTTKEDIPNSTRNLRTNYIASTEIEIEWDAASDAYGPITGYILKVIENSGVSANEFTRTFNRSEVRYRIKDLKVRTPYKIKLASINKVGTSTFSELLVSTDRSAPLPPIINKVNIIKKFLEISWKNSMPPSELYPFKYKIDWSSTIGQEYETKNIEVTSTDEGDIKCFCESTSTIHKVNIPIDRFNFNQSKIRFWVTLGFKSDFCYTNGHCPILRSTSDEFVYNVEEFMRYPDRNQNNKPSQKIILISTIICFILLMVFLGVIYLGKNKYMKEMFSNRRHHNNYSRPTGEYIEAHPREASQPKMIPLEKTPHPPIEVKDLVEHIMRYRCDDGAGFQNEFEAIELIDTSRWSITYPNRKENKAKNRYTNIFPYDHSRVLLQNTANGKSDYINASYIDGYNHRNAYIATQGPLVETICDFWQMVYEQNSEIIVMITNFDERGRRKCEMYWVPNNVVCYGNISVRQIYQKKMAFYTERRFAIKNIRNRKNTNKERIVYHYHCTDWRDFDVPSSPLPVLVFVKASTKHWTMNSGPIIVHCSAGVGRTGTYICIESQIRQMEHEHKVNVRGFLEHIRQQRMKLVQTETQYIFIHDALYEYYLCPDHDIRKDFFPDYIYQLRFGECIGFSKQFQMCTQFEPRNHEYLECKRSYNVIKNRSKILPIESRRINLCGEPGIDGSNYINASAIQGYWDMKEFIITQHPLEETEPDFWKMVWDENCTIIILLSNHNLPQFWPSDENDLRTYPWSQVNFCSNEENENISKHSFLLSSRREDFNLNCTMHRLKQWPDNVSDAADLLNLLFTVITDKVQAPIIVVDDFGGPRAGIFVALSSLLNQLRNDDIVDVYFVMKMIHMERPHIFTSSHDLKFIYEFLELVIAKQHSYPFFTTPISDLIANGLCHQNPPGTTKPTSATYPSNNNGGSFITQYATLNTLKSKSSSSSATFRRRASSAESEPFCQSTPHNRTSWNPVEITRYSLMDWSTNSSSTMMMGNGHYNGGLLTNGNGGNGSGGGGNTVQIIANPISSISDLPVAKVIVPPTTDIATVINLGDTDILVSSDV